VWFLHCGVMGWGDGYHVEIAVTELFLSDYFLLPFIVFLLYHGLCRDLCSEFVGWALVTGLLFLGLFLRVFTCRVPVLWPEVREVREVREVGRVG